MKDLTTSMVSRQNILNNNYAIDEIKNQLKLDGVEYINDTIFTKDQVAQYFNVDVRTIERCVENNKEELEKNGYNENCRNSSAKPELLQSVSLFQIFC